MKTATKQLIATLDVNWHEYWKERASIIEYEGKIPREEAEQLAFMETSAEMLKAKVRKLAEKQAQEKNRLVVRKKFDTAILATGEI